MIELLTTQDITKNTAMRYDKKQKGGHKRTLNKEESTAVNTDQRTEIKLENRSRAGSLKTERDIMRKCANIVPVTENDYSRVKPITVPETGKSYENWLSATNSSLCMVLPYLSFKRCGPINMVNALFARLASKNGNPRTSITMPSIGKLGDCYA